MSKLIKRSKLYKLNIGPYTGDKASGYYDSYSEMMHKITADFIRENKQISQENVNALHQ